MIRVQPAGSPHEATRADHLGTSAYKAKERLIAMLNRDRATTARRDKALLQALLGTPCAKPELPQ